MRVMIASLPIGTGHDIAARALAEAMGAAGVDVSFSHHLAGPFRMHTASYFWSVRHIPRIYSRMYHWGDEATFAWRRHRSSWRRIGLKLLSDVYDQYRPDWVIATHPYALTAWTALKTTHPSLKVIGVLTDLSAHQYWWEPETDAYAVWLPEQRQDLVRWGYPEDKIWDTGIPIRSIFRDDALQYARLFDGPIVVLGGGLGIGPYFRILSELTSFETPVLAVCGQNERLRWQLSQHPWPGNVTIAGYVEDMPELLCASRAVVGKPGGVTAAEVCQVQVPWVLTHWIAGQEEVNRDRLVSHNMARIGDHGLQEVLAPLLSSSALRDDMLASQARWARPNASRDIATRILAFQ